MKLWKVKKSKYFPDGVKYSFVFIHKNKRLLGYDNERAKGHHKHYYDEEINIKFESPEKLLFDFMRDVNKLRKYLYGG